MIVTHPPCDKHDGVVYVQLYVSDNDFKSCRKITMYSDLLYDEEFDELKRKLTCNVITSEDFERDYWKDDFCTKLRGNYKKISSLNGKLRSAIEKCNVCKERRCFDGSCKTYEYLSNRDV